MSYAGFHTKMTGTYKVWIFEEGEKSPRSPNGTFEVFADSVSAALSQVRAINDSAPADGESTVKVQVRLKDRYGNPIANHFVELISSRSSDEILAQNGGATDKNGSVLFSIRSEKVGISHFSALDRNSGIIPDERAKGVFYEYEERKSTSPLRASLFQTNSSLFDDTQNDVQQYGAIDHFKLEVEFPYGKNEVTETASLIITAMDEDNRIVKNYTGNVVLEALSGISKLPNDGKPIEFTAKDQGVKRLDLSLSFSEAGTHTLSAVEYEDGSFTDITGEVDIEVVSECTGSNCGKKRDDLFSPQTITIDRPQDGTTYGSKKITLKGTAIEGSELQVYIDDKAIQMVTADNMGNFFDDSIRADSDGEHTLYVKEMEMDEKSDVITFFIDTEAPQIKSYEFTPKENIKTEEMVTVTLFSEPGLQKASMKVINSNILVDFIEDENVKGKYTASFRAPKQAGEYPVDIILIDDYDNENNAHEVEVLTVGDKKPESPEKPQNVQATIGNKSVTLTWEAPASGNVKKYRVSYGTNELFLEKTAATLDDSKTTQKIEDLKNGETYYFGVVAIDENSLMSPMSNIVSATPKGEEKPVQKEITPVPITLKNTITALPGNGQVRLQWSDPQKNTQYFDIRFGIETGVYTERFAVLGNARAADIPDLINGVAYYFTVVPLDGNGIPTGEIYPEQQSMPMFTGLHNSANEYIAPTPQIKKVETLGKTGPQDIFVAFLSLSFAIAMFFFHRAFVLTRYEKYE